MSKVILLKQNNAAIRDEIRRNNIEICPCSEFVGAKWLDYYPSVGSVHGVGYRYEGMDSETTIAFVQHEWKEYNVEVIECKDVQEFIAKIFESGYGNSQQ